MRGAKNISAPQKGAFFVEKNKITAVKFGKKGTNYG